MDSLNDTSHEYGYPLHDLSVSLEFQQCMNKMFAALNDVNRGDNLKHAIGVKLDRYGDALRELRRAEDNMKYFRQIVEAKIKNTEKEQLDREREKVVDY